MPRKYRKANTTMNNEYKTKNYDAAFAKRLFDLNATLNSFDTPLGECTLDLYDTTSNLCSCWEDDDEEEDNGLPATARWMWIANVAAVIRAGDKFAAVCRSLEHPHVDWNRGWDSPGRGSVIYGLPAFDGWGIR